MAFSFWREDMTRYVRKPEHGGWHIWDELKQLLGKEFGVPFGHTPWDKRGDNLKTIWFWPKESPRSSWSNQAQLYFERSIEKQRIYFGLTIECPGPEMVHKHGMEADRDAVRFNQALQENGGTADAVNGLLAQEQWTAEVVTWGDRKEIRVHNTSEIVNAIKGLPEDPGYTVKISRSLPGNEAVAMKDRVGEHIVSAFMQVRPIWEAVIPKGVIGNKDGGTNSSAGESDNPPPGKPSLSAMSRYFDSKWFHFAPVVLAEYFTALQTKGFVLLSGLSGTGKTKMAQLFADLLRSDQEAGPNYVFLSVRPDWRDGKPLLGYFNPLTNRYQTTELLQFLLAAQSAWQHHPSTGKPLFVILDEMNLSHVEYYFADFLSVLEGGRSADGLTRETIRLCPEVGPPTDQASVPTGSPDIPSELRLPPNLYFVGTVNVDETTRAFSPKVLDRAFTIEMTEVDFERYPGAKGVGLSQAEEANLKQGLLHAFARDNRFAVIDKGQVVSFAGTHKGYRSHLGSLKDLLEPHDLHFGYRVFDEIVAFCANAEDNGLWEEVGGLDCAFDCAVLMKLLPKFHGPRSKLELPLRLVLAWARKPEDAPLMLQQVTDQTKDGESCLALRRAVDSEIAQHSSDVFRYSHTARKALRMLQALHAFGFASFS